MDEDNRDLAAGEPASSTALAEMRAEPSTMLALIARAATDPAVDVAKMEALLRMQRELEADQARAEFNAAFARLQPQLPRVKKDGSVSYPVDKNRPDGRQKKAFSYAKYEDIDLWVRPLLIKEGFSLSYDTEPQPNGAVLVIGTLMHVGGHERRARFGPAPLDTSGGKNNVQAARSTISYGQRATMTLLLNLVFEGADDDGVKGGAEFIDAEELRCIDELRRELAVDLESFCRTLAVESLIDLPKAAYPVAINLLMARKARREGKP